MFPAERLLREKKSRYIPAIQLLLKGEVTEISPGRFVITSSLNSRYALAISGAANSNGSKLVLTYITSKNNAPQNAIFSFLNYTDMGVAAIIPMGSFNAGTLRAIECSGGATADQTKLVQWTMYDTVDRSVNQFWVFENSGPRALLTNNWDLVDSSGYCDWTGSTKYQALFNTSVSAWNTYMGINRFRNRTTGVDCVISDRYEDPYNDNAIARTYSSGKIEFYTKEMDAMSSNAQRQHTITHELGHALGLAHNNGSGNIMAQGALAYMSSLGLDDKASYQRKATSY